MRAGVRLAEHAADGIELLAPAAAQAGASGGGIGAPAAAQAGASGGGPALSGR